MGRVVLASLGFSVADGDDVEVAFRGGDLRLRFTDWREHPVEHRFVEALAFRWGTRATVETPRDDEVYEAIDSSWLDQELRSEGSPKLEGFAHYILCFNAVKVLEVVSRRHLG